jgi:hypothetical protein
MHASQGQSRRCRARMTFAQAFVGSGKRFARGGFRTHRIARL